MMQQLPYIHDVIIVSEEMCDHNGHMNVNYYYKLFDSTYTSFYIDELNFDQSYLESGFSTFTLEDNIRYLKEFKLNEIVNFPDDRFQHILNVCNEQNKILNYHLMLSSI